MKRLSCTLLILATLLGMTACNAPKKNKNEGWQTAYRNYLTEEYQRIKDAEETEDASDPSQTYFDLIYIDEDDVPELIVTENFSHAGTATLITWSDGTLRAFQGLGSNGMIIYSKKKNQFVGHYYGSGNASYWVYHLDNGNLITDWYGVEQDLSWLPEKDTVNYFSFNIAVDQDTFETHYQRYIPDWFDELENCFDDPLNSDYIGWGKIALQPEEIERVFRQYN